MAGDNFLDSLRNDTESCRYCWQKNVCDNVNMAKMMPVDDRECPKRWRKRDGKSKTH